MTPFRATIDSFAEDGRGLAAHGGRRVYVTGAYPGDTVVVHPDKVTPTRVEGRVQRLLLAGAPRHPHPCTHEHDCTGCPFLSLPRPDEHALKRAGIVEGLRRAGLPHEVVDDVLAPTSELGYRAYAKQVFAGAPGALRLGSYVAGTHEVSNNSGCPVLHPELAALLEGLVRAANALALPCAERQPGLRYALARRSHHNGHMLLTLVTSRPDARLERELAAQLLREWPALRGVRGVYDAGNHNHLLGGTDAFHLGEPHIHEEVLGYRHAVGPRAFFQVNPVAAIAMYTCALEAAGTGSRAWDLYCGVGTLSLPLSERFAHVVAVESNSDATDALRDASARLRRSIETHTARVEDALERLGPAPDVVLLDPPRRGMHEAVARTLATIRPGRIVLLSCAPKTLFRDAQTLAEAGYSLRRVWPVDQFPRTAHIETVAWLER